MNYIRDKLLATTKNYYEAFFRVNRRQSAISFDPNQICGGSLSPFAGGTITENVDFVLAVKAYYDPNASAAAWARACLTDSLTGVPIVGETQVNLYHLDIEDAEFNSNIHLMLHEVAHALGFSSSFFGRFIDPATGESLGDSVYKDHPTNGHRYIVTPNVKSYLQSFYGCQDIFGSPIELDGGSGSSGSHWEKSIF